MPRTMAIDSSVLSLRLIAQAVIGQVIAEADAGLLVDALVRDGGARFPCDGTGFIVWAETQGLLVRG